MRRAQIWARPSMPCTFHQCSWPYCPAGRSHSGPEGYISKEHRDDEQYGTYHTTVGVLSSHGVAPLRRVGDDRHWLPFAY